MKTLTLPFGELLADPETQIDRIFLISKNRKIIELFVNHVKYTGCYDCYHSGYTYIFGEGSEVFEYLHQIRERVI